MTSIRNQNTLSHDPWRLALDRVTPREAEVLCLRFGVHDGHTRDLGTVARQLGITRTAARHLETYALQRLMKFSETRRFAEHLENVSAIMSRKERSEQPFPSSGGEVAPTMRERTTEAPPARRPPLVERAHEVADRPARVASQAVAVAPAEPAVRVIDPAFLELAADALPAALAASWPKALKFLTDREIIVLRLRFGLGDGAARTLGVVAREMGVTRKRAHDLEAHALERIARRSAAPEIAAFLETRRAAMNGNGAAEVVAAEPKANRTPPTVPPIADLPRVTAAREVASETRPKAPASAPFVLPIVDLPRVAAEPIVADRAELQTTRPLREDPKAAGAATAVASAQEAVVVLPEARRARRAAPSRSPIDEVEVAGVAAAGEQYELQPVPRVSSADALEARTTVIAAAKALILAVERCKTGPSAKLAGPLLDALHVVEECVEEMLNPGAAS